MEYLDYRLLGNPMSQWLVALGVGVGTFVVTKLIHKMLLRSLTVKLSGFRPILEKTYTFFFLILALAAAKSVLVLPTPLDKLLQNICIIGVFVQAFIWANAWIQTQFSEYLKNRLTEGGSKGTSLHLLKWAAKTLIFAILLLLSFEQLGINITTLIAGLGIGGIAVALAVQNILGDLLASLTIVLDEPFAVGDTLLIGDSIGTVEHVGLKTTRLRSLTGEQLIFSNSDLLQSRIRNFQRMKERRVTFRISVVYETPIAVLRRVPTLLRHVIESQKNVRFDRAHLAKFGDFALEFEVVYYLLDPDYNKMMDMQQDISFRVIEELEKEKIAFAYPTQLLYTRSLDAILHGK